MDWPKSAKEPWQSSHFSIGMDFIERIQQQACWDEASLLSEDADRSRYFYVPRQGVAKAYYLGWVMPMNFEEFEKARLSNIQDSAEERQEMLERRRQTKVAEAEALLEEERERRDRSHERALAQAKADFVERYGNTMLWPFDDVRKLETKRPQMSLPLRRRSRDNRSASPVTQPEKIPGVDTAATREITEIRRQRERRLTREAEEKKRRERNREDEMMDGRERRRGRNRVDELMEERERRRGRNREDVLMEERERRRGRNREDEMLEERGRRRGRDRRDDEGRRWM